MKPSTVRCLELLRQGPQCSQDLVAGGVGYRYSARLSELRTVGYQITKQPCTVHDHHGRQWRYHLAADPTQRSLEEATC